MRKREVIELRHRIDCVGWPCASAVINKERSLTARPGKHTGVQEHGTPDIVMFVTFILLLAGLLAGLIPAWRAMQIKAIDAIREE